MAGEMLEIRVDSELVRALMSGELRESCVRGIGGRRVHTGHDIGQLSGVSFCSMRTSALGTDTSPGGASSTNEEAICVDDILGMIVYMQLRLS